MSLLSDMPYKQRGDILLESLIGMLLMSIIGLGLVYAASRVAFTQGQMNKQSLLVSEMRETLQNNSLRGSCSSSTSNHDDQADFDNGNDVEHENNGNGNSTSSISCSYNDVSITIGDSSQSIRVMTLSDTASAVCVREVGGPECSN